MESVTIMNMIEEFNEELNDGQHLVVMPLSRVLIEDEFKIGKYRFYPIGEFEIRSLRPVPNKFHSVMNGSEMNEDEFMAIGLEGQALREAATALTGACSEVFDSSPLLVFPVDGFDWDRFLEADSHDYDLKILRSLTNEAEKVMDILKFFLCRADLIDTLPSVAGIWDQPDGFSSALIFNIDDYESYIIAGSIITHKAVKGSGLDLNNCEEISEKYEKLTTTNGEVGKIAKMALSMHTSFLESNSPTTQFVRAMTLLEFLAYPDDYQQFKYVRKKITPHLAKDYNDYLRLKDRFNKLTSKKDETGNHIGYRTRIVHIGDSIEDILEDEMQVKKVMLELQGYIGKVIEDMINNHEMSWSEFEEFREQKKRSLGIV